MRRWCVRGFDNYRIFYQPLSQDIEVRRVVYATRVRCDRTAQIAPAYGLGQRRVVCAGLDTHRRIG